VLCCIVLCCVVLCCVVLCCVVLCCVVLSCLVFLRRSLKAEIYFLYRLVFSCLMLGALSCAVFGDDLEKGPPNE
jgi:hypothetical protein